MEKIIEESKKEFSRRVKRLRLDRAWNIKTAAQNLGVSPTTVSTYEELEAQPTLESLIRYATVYDVSIDYLIGRTALRRLPTDSQINEVERLTLELGSYMEQFKRDLSFREE